MKILLLLIYSSLTLYVKNPLFQTINFLFLFLLLKIKKPTFSLGKRIKPFIFLGIIILLIHFKNPLFGYLIAIRLVIISLAVVFYLSLSSFSEIIDVFGFLPNIFKLLLAITFYSIPLVINEYEQIILVQKSRGYKSSVFNPIASTIPLLVPLLHRVFQRSETLALTVASKGFKK